MRHVIDHVRVVVGIDRADPLVHARALPWACRAQGNVIERLFNIVHDGACLVHSEIAVLENRHAIEGMQCQVSGFTHLRFEIVEGVGDILVSEHQAYDLNKSAAWESKYNRIRHLFLPIRNLVPLGDREANYGTMIHVLQVIYRIDTVRIEAWRLEQSKALSGRDICEDAKKLPTVSGLVRERQRHWTSVWTPKTWRIVIKLDPCGHPGGLNKTALGRNRNSHRTDVIRQPSSSGVDGRERDRP